MNIVLFVQLLLITRLASCGPSPRISKPAQDGKNIQVPREINKRLSEINSDFTLNDADGSDNDSYDYFDGKHVLSGHLERAENFRTFNILIRDPPNEGSKNVEVGDELINNFINQDKGGANDDKPIFVVNLDDIVNKLRMWHRNIPRVHPFFAIKCNDDPNIAKVLAAIGTGFDCASMSEIDQALSMGVKPDKIIFANPIKPGYHIMYAKARGVKYMTFDCETELEKIKKFFPEAKLVMRLKVRNEGAEHKLSDKFGVRESDHEKLLKKAIEMNLTVSGTSFHVGSLQNNPDTFTDAIKLSKDVFKSSEKLGMKRFHILDIGGGFPGFINYDDPDDLFYKMVKNINTALDTLFPKSEYPYLKILSEPGRYFPTSAVALISKVIGKKVIELDKKPVAYYYINDGLYHSFMTYLFDLYQANSTNIVYEDVETRKMLNTTIWGQTYFAPDVIMENVMFPELNIGEHIVKKRFGAYSFSFRSDFNRSPTPVMKYVISNKNKKFLLN